MKNNLFIILLIFISNNSFSQDISGSYRWLVDEGQSSFVIDLSPRNSIRGSIPTSFKGEHCGVYFEGKRMDCSDGDISIYLDKVSENVFTGTILSAYSNSVHDIKVTYLPTTKQIRWEVTNKRSGQIYFPLNVIMD